MSSPKYYQNHLKVQASVMDDPPLYFYGPPGFQTRVDASGSYHEEVLCDTVLKYSSKPYDEFCASMVEMVLYKLDCDLTVDGDYMEELLLHYLELNEKKVHKYIVQAFLDVMGVLNGQW